MREKMMRKTDKKYGKEPHNKQIWLYQEKEQI